MMGVAGLVGDPANPEYESLLPPVPLGPGGRRIAEGFNALGWHWWPSYSAINTHRHGGRAACVNLGPCNTGCSQGAKGSVDVTYWPAAYRQGVRLIAQARVLEITLNAMGQASGVLYQDATGAQHRLTARLVVVACNGIGTPRLLLNSRSSAFPDGLANESGQLGRNLMLHPLGFVEGAFEDDLQSSIGPHGCCLFSQQFYETDPARDFVRGYTMQVLRGAPALETALAGFMKRQIQLGPSLHQDFRRLFNRTMGIAVIAEDLPEADNRVELDTEHPDRWGMPGAKVHYTLSDNTRKMLTHGLDHSKQVIEAAGGKVIAAFAPVRNTGWHLMGTARMGQNAQDSVVNAYGQAHGVPQPLHRGQQHLCDGRGGKSSRHGAGADLCTSATTSSAAWGACFAECGTGHADSSRPCPADALGHRGWGRIQAECRVAQSDGGRLPRFGTGDVPCTGTSFGHRDRKWV